MLTLNPHINFNGNAEQAFLFYQSIFGGEFAAVIRFKDLQNDNFKVVEHEADKIMHIELPIGDTFLMGNDVPEILGKTNENRSKIVIRTDTKDEAVHIFNHLSEEGTIEVPIGDSPWDSCFGMLRDKYGIEWIIEFK